MSESGHTGGDRGRLGNLLSGLAVAIGCVLFLGGFIWGAVLYQPYTVPTNSMAPTVGAGDRVLAQRIDGGEVRRGDVVVFRDELWGSIPMIKRVVGVGGDRVACCDRQGRLTINGEPVEEPYLDDEDTEAASPMTFATMVPEGRLFLLGDHRTESIDSRARLTDAGQGSIAREMVSARVDATVWPVAGAGMVSRPMSFAGLPGGVSEPGPLKLVLAAVVAGAALVLGGAAYVPVAQRVARLRGRRAGGSRSAEAM